MSMHLGRLLAQRAAMSPTREALVGPDGRWTFADFDERCARLASHLLSRGVREGDRVAVLAKNSEFLANAVFAAARIGATAVVLNWRLQVAELVYVLGDSEPSALLYEDTFAPVTRQLLQDRSVLALVRKGSEGEGADYDSIVATAVARPPAAQGPGGEVPAVIMYTSGTTGRPKGAMLSHDALFWAAQANSCTLEWNQDHRFLLVAPMFHIGGLSPLVTNVLKGCTTVLLPDFDPVQVWQTIAAERITSLMSVPLMLQALLAVLQKTPMDTSSLVSVTCGASAVPQSLILAAHAMGIRVQQVYGITEFCGAVTFWTLDLGLDTAHSQGKPLMHGEVKIVDPVTLQDCPAGRGGEIWCRGPMMFSGYWRNPDATAAVLQQGWYRSGDIGRVDEHGLLYVVDRLKDMVISGGENVYPAELEAVIAAVPGVAEVAVVGRPDARWGEVPIAYVVRRPGAQLDEDGVMCACKANLAGYKCVKDVRFVDSLPRSPVGKVLKQQLRQLA